MPEKVLYLFSSNASPRYAQDIMNVIGLPKGSRYVFRYSAKYVEDSIVAPAGWTAVANKEALVCFSLQQKAKYVPAVFIPVRTATVKSARIIGSTHIVEFQLGDLVAIPPADDEQERPQQVRDFSDWVRANTDAHPYERSVSLGNAPTDLWHGEADQPLIFEALAWWLSRAESFSDARFVRFERLAETGDQTELASVDDQGRLQLESGKTYELRLVQHQGQEISDTRPFVVSTDNAHITVIGRPGFDVASRYDEIRIGLQLVPLSGVKAIETVLVVEPAPGGSAPRLQMPIRIKPPTSQAVLSVIGPIGVLAALGLPTALHASQPLTITLVAVSLVGTFALQLLGINVTAPSNPFPAATPATTVTINAGQSTSKPD